MKSWNKKKWSFIKIFEGNTFQRQPKSRIHKIRNIGNNRVKENKGKNACKFKKRILINALKYDKKKEKKEKKNEQIIKDLYQQKKKEKCI